MLLDKFKSNHTFNFIFFPLLGMLVWVRNFIDPKQYSFYPGEANNLLYAPVQRLLDQSLLLQNLVALVLFLLLAFLILQINIRFNLIRVRTMIPATLFVLMAGGFTEIHLLHPVYFGALFFLIALYRLLSAFDKQQPFSAAFDTGFFLGIASLFYFSMVAFLPAFLIGIGILSREVRLRNFFILLTGMLLPFLFGASFAFVTDSLGKYLELMKSSFYTINNKFMGNIALQGYIIFLAVLTLLASLKIIKDYDTKKVSTRKSFIVFFLVFLCSVAAVLFIPAVSQEMLLIAIIPVTFLVTNYFVFIKSYFLGEFIFMCLLVAVVVMQFVS